MAWLAKEHSSTPYIAHIKDEVMMMTLLISMLNLPGSMRSSIHLELTLPLIVYTIF